MKKEKKENPDPNKKKKQGQQSIEKRWNYDDMIITPPTKKK